MKRCYDYCCWFVGTCRVRFSWRRSLGNIPLCRSSIWLLLLMPHWRQLLHPSGCSLPLQELLRARCICECSQGWTRRCEAWTHDLRLRFAILLKSAPHASRLTPICTLTLFTVRSVSCSCTDSAARLLFVSATCIQEFQVNFIGIHPAICSCTADHCSHAAGCRFCKLLHPAAGPTPGLPLDFGLPALAAGG